MNKFKHNKDFGQHFLIDNEIINLIMLSAGDLTNKTVIEIGPGNFAITKPLLVKAKKVIAIEIDKRIEPNLVALKKQHDNFDYIMGDALHINPNLITGENKVLISNLPYNVGTQIYLNYLQQSKDFEYFLLMFQLEVAKRITANVGDSHFGRLSLISDLLSKREFLFEVAPTSFNPPPQVVSAVIKVSPLSKPRIEVDINNLEKITNMAFSGKRKTIKNSLGKLNLDFEALNINPQKRPQELSLEEFCKISNTILIS
ncbi:MAG: 16S rRNA (adenine(1518)-N(6)/adenine(1519)-N(6))-dimethyltransferase RsmA [Alphaproteobacteria bacterium]|jgi:16S rRNA (adenine1518-N6/adenine1519-N6)-dimethyltransferase|nr:16S rRNA (adenine(1518)-N(6)/adenine(1519)-N(6))-dimethyltransferase RsmA [Alphaproteobacteria bacterium]